MSVTLRKRKNKDGTTSLRLDIYKDGKRFIETLKHLQLSKPSNPSDRENNKKLVQQAEAIRLSRAVELEGNNYNVASEAGKKTIVTVWMQNYIDGYSKKDKRNMEGVLKRFINFLTVAKSNDLTFSNLTPLLIEDFIDYLQENSKGEGARSYYARFKKMLKNAFRKGVMQANILDLVEKSPTGAAKKKDTLTQNEIKLLAATPINSNEIKRAALFCCVTGLAWIDVKELTWGKIKLNTGQLEIVRSKLKSRNKTVTIPLNNTAIKLLDEPGDKETLVFKLPSADGANKTLKAWVKRAEINKSITWHNLRHSYGTNLILNDVDILSTSSLMGHGSTSQTLRYVTAAEELKQRGTDKLNFDL